MPDTTHFRGWPIPAAAGDPPAGGSQIRALGAAADLDVAALAADIVQAQADILNGFRLLQTVIFSATGTFSKGDYAGLRMVVVEVWGPGGGSGGTPATSASQVASAGGGGGGGYSRKTILEASLLTSETVTVGTGGIAGTAGGSGGTGTTSSFGAHATATGGAGGQSGSAVSDTTGGAARTGGTGGAGASGDFNLPGNTAAMSMVATGSPLRNGNGANAPMMSGAAVQSTIPANGVAATGKGAGAAGALADQSESARVGAAGSDGYILVHVYV